MINGLDKIMPETEQKGILALAALNKLDKKDHPDITKKMHIDRLEISYHYRSSKSWMGRFGGGWQWCVGIDIGSTSVHVKLLVCSIMFHVRKKEVKNAKGTH